MRRGLAAALLGCGWGVALCLRVQAAQGPPAQLIDFATDVQPILQANCLECHSQEKRKGGLSLVSYADVLEGGRSGPAVRPGSGAISLIFHRISGETEPQMPLDELPLGEAEIATLRAWIDQGARPNPAAPPAPPPWEAPLALTRPDPPGTIWPTWSDGPDPFVAAYLSEQGAREPQLVTDAVFARRAHLDIWGLLPEPAALTGFVNDRSSDKRRRLVRSLLADGDRYAQHWISFWNDLLRNEDGVTYYSEKDGRKSITDWLLASLRSNLRYDEFVRRLLNPTDPGDPEGFLIGVNWRGETSAAVTPWMQASQNTAQVFLGVNMKCNACHDSFINRWKLKDAYALAAYFSPEPKLQLFRCDVARDEFAGPGFLFPELTRVPVSPSLADRRAVAAAIFTDPRNGRMPRTIVNRIWERLLGHGIVSPSDEMDGTPWSPALLDWLASDFVEHGYDLAHLIETIVSSRAYQMPAVARDGEAPARGYVFAGPEIRRITAEQFSDAIGSITGEWSVAYPPVPRPAGDARPRTVSDPVSAGIYAREWRAASSDLTRALGRPVRDQVISRRAAQPTTLQALELVNGEQLTFLLARGARRLLGRLPSEPPSLFNGAVAGRYAAARPFEVEISGLSRLWLIVTDTGSNAPERVLPVLAGAELVAADGSVTPLATLAPVEASGLREPLRPGDNRVRLANPSRLVYEFGGAQFARLRGAVDLENPRAEIGSTLNPSIRFFVFGAEPNLERLVPPAPDLPQPPPPLPNGAADLVTRLFRHALGREPSPAERQAAEAAVADSTGAGQLSADGVVDLLWVLLMKPEFQLIY